MGTCSCKIDLTGENGKEVHPEDYRKFSPDNVKQHNNNFLDSKTPSGIESINQNIPKEKDQGKINAIILNDNNKLNNFKLKKNNNASNNNKINNNQLEYSFPLDVGTFITKEEFDNLVGEKIINIILQKPIDFSAYIPKNKKLFNIKKHEMNPIKFKDNTIYYGRWNDQNQMDGYGKYLIVNEGILYEGLWDQNELYFSRMFIRNESIYIGQLKNYSPHGKGTYFFEGGDVYEGDFDKGEMTGEGTYTFDDGTVYRGSVFNGVINGKGEMKWTDGTFYEGGFVNNYLNGYGVLKRRKEKYEGQFSQNIFHGKGKYTFSNGEEYYGDFLYGVKEGKGTFSREDGLVFEGTWENDLPNGKGKIIYNNIILNCNYRKGKIIDYKPVKGNFDYFNNNTNFNFSIFPPKIILKTEELLHLNLVNKDLNNFQPMKDINFEENEQ